MSMSVQEQPDPKIISFCSKYYPSLAKNYNACRRLYFSIMRAKRPQREPPKKVKIGEIQPGDRVEIEGVVVSKYHRNYEGCPDTLKAEPCEDGSLGVITVYRMEVADETDSVWVVAFAPISTDRDYLLTQIEPGDIIKFRGMVKERELPDGSKRLEIVVFRGDDAIEILETKEERLKEIVGDETEPTQETEEEPGELVEDEEPEEETIPEEVEQFLDVLQQLGRIPEKALPKLLDKYGLTREQVEPYIRVENGKVYPK